MMNGKAGEICHDWDSDSLLSRERDAFKPWKYYASRDN
jgi:hypothetical protein